MNKIKNYRLLLSINAIFILFFSLLFIYRKNYEFLIYVGVIIVFFFIIIYTKKRVLYPPIILWGLTFWSLMHMTGGGIYLNGKKIYQLMLLPLVGEPYNILKYDQFVHFFGFGIATLIMFYLIKPYLKENTGKVALMIVIIMAGLGVGAFNEIIEFIATVLVPETGVGGYENTSLDLVFNLIGAIFAGIYILKKESRG